MDKGSDDEERDTSNILNCDFRQKTSAHFHKTMKTLQNAREMIIHSLKEKRKGGKTKG